MNSKIDFICKYISENEGGYSNDPDDSGGPTNWGITQDDLAKWRGKDVSADDVKNMSFTEAENIYIQYYLNPAGARIINDPGVACCICDAAILYGKGTAVKYAQQVANILGCALTVDGVMGPFSAASINELTPSLFVKGFVARILQRIDEICEANPTQEKFRNGWTDRANRMLTLI